MVVVFFAYRNSFLTTGQIQRTLNPLLKDYESQVITEYRKNPGLPCLIPPFQRQVFEDLETVTITIKINPYFKLNTRSCGRVFANPDALFTPPRPTPTSNQWIFHNNMDPSQFYLKKGKYKLDSINISGTSPTLQQFGIEFDSVFTEGPFYNVCRKDLFSFLFFSVLSHNPVVFNAESNPPPLVGPLDPGAAMKINQVLITTPDNDNYVQFDVPATPENNFVFDVPTDDVYFAFRLNAPIWQVQGRDQLGRVFTKRANAVGTFTASVKLSKIS